MARGSRHRRISTYLDDYIKDFQTLVENQKRQPVSYVEASALLAANLHRLRRARKKVITFF